MTIILISILKQFYLYLQVKVSAHEGPVGITIVGVDKPHQVHVEGTVCPKHVYNPITSTLTFKCEHNKRGAIIDVTF